MITFTLPQWHALTYIACHEYTRLGVRYADIQAGCEFASRAQTRDVLDYLARKGLVELHKRQVNGRMISYARSNQRACGTVGVEV